MSEKKVIKKVPPDAEITIDISKGNIAYSFQAYHRIEDDGQISWYIPSFKVFFSTKTKEEGKKRAISSVDAFIHYWLNRQKSFRSFVLELHHLGFRAPKFHDLTLNRLLTRKIAGASLGYMNGHAAEEFPNSSSEEVEGNLSVAV